jgi:hypothetical protein
LWGLRRSIVTNLEHGEKRNVKEVDRVADAAQEVKHMEMVANEIARVGYVGMIGGIRKRWLLQLRRRIRARAPEGRLINNRSLAGEAACSTCHEGIVTLAG